MRRPPSPRAQRIRVLASLERSPRTRHPLRLSASRHLGGLLLCLPVVGGALATDASFVFDNRSGATVIVSYTVKQKQEWPASTTPALARSAQGEGGWRALRPGEYLASSDGRTRTAEVKTGESLRIAIVERYPGHGLRGLWTFPIDSFQIADAKSSTAATVAFAGCEALLSFERWEDALYVLQVKQAKVVTPAK